MGHARGPRRRQLAEVVGHGPEERTVERLEPAGAGVELRSVKFNVGRTEPGVWVRGAGKKGTGEGARVGMGAGGESGACAA